MDIQVLVVHQGHQVFPVPVAHLESVERAATADTQGYLVSVELLVRLGPAEPLAIVG